MSSRPSVTSRLSFAISTASNAERGESVDAPSVAADQQIDEEIAEIKRYEVCAPWLSISRGSQLTSFTGFHDYRYDSQFENPNISFTTTDKGPADWVQDAARERVRRKARRKQAAGLYEAGQFDWRQKIWTAYEDAQGWIVVTIIGVAIGFNAAFLNIITEWLSDIKAGHCTTAFYLNEKFCCWGEDNGQALSQGHCVLLPLG